MGKGSGSSSQAQPPPLPLHQAGMGAARPQGASSQAGAGLHVKAGPHVPTGNHTHSAPLPIISEHQRASAAPPQPGMQLVAVPAFCVPLGPAAGGGSSGGQRSLAERGETREPEGGGSPSRVPSLPSIPSQHRSVKAALQQHQQDQQRQHQQQQRATQLLSRPTGRAGRLRMGTTVPQQLPSRPHPLVSGGAAHALAEATGGTGAGPASALVEHVGGVRASPPRHASPGARGR